MSISLGFDTSNYTTSCAYFDGVGGVNNGRLLDVAAGQLGLRQSEALFSHVRRMPDIVADLDIKGDIMAIGASTAPRETEGSYMPCFLAGAGHAQVLASVLKVPFYAFSHQQGHIAAAAWSSGHIELMDAPMLCWHLSGGTTELLYVVPDGVNVRCEIIGGTQDVSAGQLIDRTGQLLNLQFPSGRALDELQKKAQHQDMYAPKLNGLSFSLSGVEHKMKQLIEKGSNSADIAYFSLASVISAVLRVTEKAISQYGDIPVLFSGGVASNSLLREKAEFGYFAEPKYSTDNAMGTAILTYRQVMQNG